MLSRINRNIANVQETNTTVVVLSGRLVQRAFLFFVLVGLKILLYDIFVYFELRSLVRELLA